MVVWKTEQDTVPLHTVLIICDEPKAIADWDALLNERNCIVLSEPNTRNALQTARLVSPSLILVDLKASKAERAGLIASLRDASRSPILLLVSADTVEDVMDANQAGADECLIKPVNPAVLIVKAMALLGHGLRSERPIQIQVDASI
jgi:DNA-binding response OmpR family regulator